MSNQKKYQAELFYGYQESESGIYHSFELADQCTHTDVFEVSGRLAELLDTKPGNPDFTFGTMYVDLPEPLIERIKAEAVMEYLAKCAESEGGDGL